MNATLADALAAEVASLERVASVPSGELGYGADLACILDVEPTLAEVDPASPRGIGQAVIRRLLTPRGALIDSPNYGLDVRPSINRGMAQRDLIALAGTMRGEALKDDRVADASFELQVSADGATLQIVAMLTPVDPGLQLFTLTFAVSSDAAELIETIGATGG